MVVQQADVIIFSLPFLTVLWEKGYLAGTIVAPALEFYRASTYDASLQVRSDSDTLWGSTLQLS